MAPMTSLCAGRPGLLQVEQAIHFGFPLFLQSGRLSRVFRVHTVIGQRRRQLLERDARVGHQRNRGHLVGVDFRGVDVDEAAPRDSGTPSSMPR